MKRNVLGVMGFAAVLAVVPAAGALPAVPADVDVTRQVLDIVAEALGPEADTHVGSCYFREYHDGTPAGYGCVAGPVRVDRDCKDSPECAAVVKAAGAAFPVLVQTGQATGLCPATDPQRCEISRVGGVNSPERIKVTCEYGWIWAEWRFEWV